MTEAIFIMTALYNIVAADARKKKWMKYKSISMVWLCIKCRNIFSPHRLSCICICGCEPFAVTRFFRHFFIIGANRGWICFVSNSEKDKI